MRSASPSNDAYRTPADIGRPGHTLRVNMHNHYQHDQEYSVSQTPPPSNFFLTFFANGWEFLIQILLAYYTFLSTLGYKFLFNYLQF